MKPIALALCLAAVGCAGTTPREFITAASHYLSAAQDVQQRAERVYTALCFEREGAPDCVELRKALDTLTLENLLGHFTQAEQAAQGPQ